MHSFPSVWYRTFSEELNKSTATQTLQSTQSFSLDVVCHLEVMNKVSLHSFNFFFSCFHGYMSTMASAFPKMLCYRVTNFLPKLVHMLLFYMEKNWISIYWFPRFSAVAQISHIVEIFSSWRFFVCRARVFSIVFFLKRCTIRRKLHNILNFDV